jgi:hypothetical protein
VQLAILDTDIASLLHRRKLAGPLATRLIGREPLITRRTKRTRHSPAARLAGSVSRL